jgi:hypothetical protein
MNQPKDNPVLARLAAIKAKSGSGHGVSLSKRDQMIPGAEFDNPLIVLGLPEPPVLRRDINNIPLDAPPTASEMEARALELATAAELIATQSDGVGALYHSTPQALNAIAECRTGAIERLDNAIKQGTLIETLDRANSPPAVAVLIVP